MANMHPHHGTVRSLVARNLTRILRDQNFTVAALTRKSGVSKTAILQIRRKEKGARIDTLAQLADASRVRLRIVPAGYLTTFATCQPSRKIAP